MLKILSSTLVALTLLSAPALAAQHVVPPLAIAQTFTVDDLQAALDDANRQNPPDTRHGQCWQAAITFVQNLSPAVDVPQRPGLAQAIQKGLDLKARPSLLPDSLVQACALTMSDLRLDVVKFAGMIGVGVANPIHLPFPVPGLP